MKNKIETTKNYTTRDGCEVRIYAMDGDDSYPIHGAVKQENGKWSTAEWTEDGRYLRDGSEDVRDLVEVVEQKVLKGWLNIYSSGVIGNIYDSKEESDSVKANNRIACVYVEIPYKEGEGLQVSLD